MSKEMTPDGHTSHDTADPNLQLGQSEPSTGSSPLAATFREVALRVHQNGFVIMPVEGKAAFLKSFSKLWLQPQSVSTVSKWMKSHGAKNTGLCLGEIVAIDIDIDDPLLADEVHSSIVSRLGESEFVRFGRRPRRVLLYRFDRLMAEHVLQGWSVGSSETGKVEMLGPGRQVVIYGTHPDTGLPYEWPKRSPLNDPIDAVPWTADEELGELKSMLEKRLQPASANVKSAAAVKPPTSATTLPKADDTRAAWPWALDYLPEPGERGDYLYWYAREKAVEYEALVDLTNDMIAKNATFSEPQTRPEVIATARSTWKQKLEGRLMRSGKNAPAVLPVRRETLADCVPTLSPHSCKLYLTLVATRPSHVPFSIPQQSTAQYLRMGKPTLVGAIRALIANGLIEVCGSQPNKKEGRYAATLYKFP